ncbi:GH25 family lysozyme [Clostridium oryzae]|uniref:GH25 family lysozyme n=1 Tax=Clostridium oryzae TaxID=1450648 RepID=UPI001476361C|nr:GH25 family lysozyme [Clostridium oryzae]
MSKIKGIDVSKWQGTINWNKVKNDGIKFAIIRASYGKDHKDPAFESNYSGAKKAGIAVGAYHYCYAKSTDEAKKEAAGFVSAVMGKTFEYPLVVDMEDKSLAELTKAALTDITNTFLSAVAEAGFTTMVYASKSWYDSKLDASRLMAHKIWIARYNDTLDYDGRYDIWQYSSSGSVAGISGHVDMNYLCTDIVSLKQPAKALQHNDKSCKIKNSPAILSVKDIQERLNLLYRLHIEADNKFGHETLKAVIKGLQIELNKLYKAKLKVDGVFGPATRSKLIVVKKGMKGNMIFLLQALLICKGCRLKPYGADGSFGSLTESRVRSYQKAEGLQTDGIVGAATWSKLLA